MIGFVIPYYKAKEDLERCKECIVRQDVEHEIFVYDNSIDNRYYTAAANKGIIYFLLQDTDYICLIDQDVFLEDGAIKKMLELISSKPDCGIVNACFIQKEGDEICVDTGGYACLPVGSTLQLPRRIIEDAPMFWVSLSCCLLRPEMIEEIGLLDENLVHLCSDVDYCFTARSRGWEVWRSKAIGIHNPKSLNLSNDLKMRKQKDIEHFVKKWGGGLFNELSFTWQKDASKQDIVIFKKGEKINVGS